MLGCVGPEPRRLIDGSRERGSGWAIGFGGVEALAAGWLNFKRLRRLEVRSAFDEPPVAGGIRGCGVSAGLITAEA